MNILCEIGERWGSDKHDDVHFPKDGDLASFYHNLLKDRRESTRTVLEVGIGTKEAMRHTGKSYTPGASLFMWEAYFPNALIYALDINWSVLVDKGRIASFQCDQGCEASLHNAKLSLPKKFDFIVDDGSHIPEHQVMTANAFMSLLKPDGIYAIEDIPLQARDFVQANILYKSEFHEVRDIYGDIGDLVLVIRKGKQ